MANYVIDPKVSIHDSDQFYTGSTISQIKRNNQFMIEGVPFVLKALVGPSIVNNKWTISSCSIVSGSLGSLVELFKDSKIQWRPNPKEELDEA